MYFDKNWEFTVIVGIICLFIFGVVMVVCSSEIDKARIEAESVRCNCVNCAEVVNENN